MNAQQQARALKRQYEREYARRNPDWRTNKSNTYRASALDAIRDGHTRADVFNRANGKCEMCGIVLDSKHWHKDHIIEFWRARQLGIRPDDTINNVRATCPPCTLTRKRPGIGNASPTPKPKP